MTGTEAITSVQEMEGQLNQVRHALHCEIEDIQEQWSVLENMGGARDDHAASLLSRLRPALDDLSRLAATMSQQITKIVADPFGTKE